MFDLKEFWDSFNHIDDIHHNKYHDMNINNHPYICVGTFYKTILEGKNIAKSLTQLLKSNSPKDTNHFLHSTQIYLYNKATINLKHLDFSNEYHLDQIRQHPKNKILEAINLAIPIFEQLEFYENCALLKKLENSL